MKIFAFCLLFGSSCSFGQSDVEAIESSVDIFYQWYFESIKDGSYFKNIMLVQNGEYCKLESENYFSKLRNLKVLDDVFIINEVERLKPCKTYLESVPWELYINEENGSDLDEYCDFLNYYYWIRSQEKFDGYEVSEPSISGSTATVLVKFYVDNNEKYSESGALVSLNREAKKWLITNIQVVNL